MDRVGMLGGRPARSVVVRGVSSVLRTVQEGFLLLQAWARALLHAARALFVRPSPNGASPTVSREVLAYELNPTSLRQNQARSLGTHLLVELLGCPAKPLERVEYVEKVLIRAAHASRAKIVSHFFHEFEPYGVSGVVVIEESHYTIHTWPEYGYAAVDLFFCSEKVESERALEVLQEAFCPEQMQLMKVQRGVLRASPG